LPGMTDAPATMHAIVVSEAHRVHKRARQSH
jgi:hypothetical protein